MGRQLFWTITEPEPAPGNPSRAAQLKSAAATRWVENLKKELCSRVRPLWWEAAVLQQPLRMGGGGSRGPKVLWEHHRLQFEEDRL